MAAPIALDDARYVAFGGCGVKGVAYLGALAALQKHHAGHAEWHRRLRGACGSSSGCVAALAFLVDADADALVERWRSLHIESIAPYVDLNGVLSRYGMDGGSLVRRIIREAFAACGLAHDTTFATLRRLTGRDLRICVTNLNHVRREVFSPEDTPDVVVSRAMYWSMCVPFVFEPETFRGDVMVDGCALSYVPYDVWPLEQTVVFHAHGHAMGLVGGPRREIGDLRAFASGVLACCAHSALRTADELSRAHPERFVRIAVLDKQHDAMLNMSDATLRALVGLGFATVLFRLCPDVPIVLDRLLRMSIGLAAAPADEESAATELM